MEVKQAVQLGRPHKALVLASPCLPHCVGQYFPLSSFFALLFALSLHLSLPFSMPPLSSFSSHSNCLSTLLFMSFCLPFLPLPPHSLYPVIFCRSFCSLLPPPLTFSVCLLQFLPLDKNFAFSASCNNFGALWLSSQIFGPCATWAYFYLFAAAVGKNASRAEGDVGKAGCTAARI